MGRSKKKTTGPSSTDVQKTKPMDAILGVSELDVEEKVEDLVTLAKMLQSELVEGILEWVKSMERSGQNMDIGMNSILPILKSGNSKPASTVSLKENKPSVKINKEDKVDEINYWMPSIVGYVARENPPLNVFEGFARRI